MLPAPHRMRRGRDFDTAVRGGRRVGRRTLVVHAARVVADPGNVRLQGAAVDPPALIGLVVSRAVGSAVVRTHVKRRLRALLARRIETVPRGVLLVVRANPAASDASSQALAADLDVVLPRVLRALAADEHGGPARPVAAGGER